LTVVATTTVLAHFVEQVGGDRVAVHALVPKGGEVHTFDPAPSDAARLAQARLLVMNGLGLDDWLLDLAGDAGQADLPLVELAEDLEDVEYLEGEEEGDHPYNPHLWLNVQYARRYVDRIRLKLIEVDPANQADYDANAEAYDEQLEALDAYVHEQLADIPQADRRVVSFHDAFPYFAAAYGLEIVGVVVSAPGQEPSAGEVARLVTEIRETGVKAILAEAQFSDRPARAIADETDAMVVSELYTDSLGDPPQDSYEGAMRWNVDRVVEVLR
jgi:zinc/manganese transport system substrate-binding protein/manganese/iron transport system substrate-binding protein